MKKIVVSDSYPDPGFLVRKCQTVCLYIYKKKTFLGVRINLEPYRESSCSSKKVRKFLGIPDPATK
jgi:hypothetical protein